MQTTHKELLPQESKMDTCQTLPFLAISDHSLVKGTPKAIKEWLMLSQVDSPVNRLATQGKNLGQTTPEICGPQLSQPSALYDPVLHSWKTLQGWLLVDILEPSWEIWPKAGMIADGVFYPQPRWEDRIAAIEFGLLPTPRVWMANGAIRTDKENAKFRNLEDFTPEAKLNPNLVENMMGWPMTWTDLQPLETDKFREWRRRHGDF